MTFSRSATGPVSLNSSVMAVARPWTLQSEVSRTMSAEVPQFLQQFALGGDAVEDPAAALQRVRAPALLEAADQDVVVGVQEQHPEGDAAGLEGARARPGCPRTASLLRTSITTASLEMDCGAWDTSSASVPSICGGRFSTTYQPWSSRASEAVLRPAPDMPVTTSSSASTGLTGVMPSVSVPGSCRRLCHL